MWSLVRRWNGERVKSEYLFLYCLFCEAISSQPGQNVTTCFCIACFAQLSLLLSLSNPPLFLSLQASTALLELALGSYTLLVVTLHISLLSVISPSEIKTFSNQEYKNETKNMCVFLGIQSDTSLNHSKPFIDTCSYMIPIMLLLHSQAHSMAPCCFQNKAHLNLAIISLSFFPLTNLLHKPSILAKLYRTSQVSPKANVQKIFIQFGDTVSVSVFNFRCHLTLSLAFMEIN